MNFQKQKPKVIADRDYKKINNNTFRHDIEKCNFNTADNAINKPSQTNHLEVKRSFSRKVIKILQMLLNYVKCKIIKLNKDIFAKFISNNFNHCIDEGEFPYQLKHTDVILVHKKKKINASGRMTNLKAY